MGETSSSSLPSNWKFCRLSDVCDKAQYGYTASAKSEGSGPKFLRITDISNGSISWNDVPLCECSQEEFKKYRLVENDIVIARIGATTGFTAIVKDPPQAVFASYLIKFAVRPGVSPDFLFFYTKTAEYWEQVNSHKRNYLKGGINGTHLSELNVPIPPLAEQRNIAAILWKIQQAIEVETDLIRVSRELKAAVMKKLFTEGLNGEPLKETEIGLVPESWIVSNPSDIFKLTSGKKRPKDFASERQSPYEFPIFGGNGVMGFAPEWFVDENECLIIGRVGEYCGAVHIGNGKIWISDNALYAVQWLSGDLRIRFVAHFLTYYDLNRFKKKSSQPLVTQGLINDHKIPCPPLKEQDEIIRILNTLDSSISLHVQKVAVLKETFSSMLSFLMSASIRVTDLDIDTSCLESQGVAA